VSKGPPSGADGLVHDRMAIVRQAAGVSHAPRQPDIRLAFWEASNPRLRVYALGDAKRNASGDGVGYIKDSLDVAVLYLVAYARDLGVELSPDPGRLLSAPIWPPFTLFVRRAPASAAPADELVSQFRNDVAKPSPVLTLYLDHHFPPGAPESAPFPVVS